MSTITIRQATTKDIDPFVHCINQAYRKKEPGAWTTEEHLLTGDRINNEGVLELLKIDAHLPRLIVAESEETIVGTLEIEIEEHGTSVVYGLFSVLAAYQSKGIGKKLLIDAIMRSKAQNYTVGVMYVIEIREDLLAWYLKMGFKDTKKTKIIEEVAAKSKGPPIVFKRLEMDLTEFAV